MRKKESRLTQDKRTLTSIIGRNKSTSNSKRQKRGHGEGSLYMDEQRGHYWVRVTYKDPLTKESRRKKLKGTTTKNESLEIGRNWKEQAERTKRPQNEQLTLAEWVDQWLQLYVKNKIRQKAYEKYESCLRVYICPALGKALLRNITGEDLQAVLDELLEKGGRQGNGLSTSTIRATRRYLSICINKAVTKGLVEHNFVKDTKPPKLITAEFRPLELAEQKVLKEKAKGLGEVAHMAISLTLATGMRLGEVFGLTWRDVEKRKTGDDKETARVYVRRSLVTTAKMGQILQPPKTASSGRSITIPDETFAELQLYKEWQDLQRDLLGNKWADKNLVFANSFGNYMDTSNFTSRVFKVALVNAGLDRGIKFHHLRHTHAITLLRQGAHPKIVQERLGHKDIRLTLNIYCNYIPDLQDIAKKYMDDALASQQQPEKGSFQVTRGRKKRLTGISSTAPKTKRRKNRRDK